MASKVPRGFPSASGGRALPLPDPQQPIFCVPGRRVPHVLFKALWKKGLPNVPEGQLAQAFEVALKRVREDLDRRIFDYSHVMNAPFRAEPPPKYVQVVKSAKAQQAMLTWLCTLEEVSGPWLAAQPETAGVGALGLKWNRVIDAVFVELRRELGLLPRRKR